MQKRLLAVVVATIAILFNTTRIYVYVVEWTRIPRPVWTIAFVLTFFVFYIYHLIAASSFIFYDDEDGKIILRSYQLNMFNTSKNSYEIPKSELKGFSIKESYWNLKKEIILYRKHQGKVVIYPPVSISLLHEKELQNLLESLRSFGPQIEQPVSQ